MTLNSYGMICDQYSLLALICDKYCSWEHDLLQAVVMGTWSVASICYGSSTIFVTSAGYGTITCNKYWLWEQDISNPVTGTGQLRMCKLLSVKDHRYQPLRLNDVKCCTNYCCWWRYSIVACNNKSNSRSNNNNNYYYYNNYNYYYTATTCNVTCCLLHRYWPTARTETTHSHVASLNLT